MPYEERHFMHIWENLWERAVAKETRAEKQKGNTGEEVTMWSRREET